MLNIMHVLVIPVSCEDFDESFLISGDIEECNTSKFHAIVLTPKMGNSSKRGLRRGRARINVNGMTCNKCVNFIQTKVSQYLKGNKSLDNWTYIIRLESWMVLALPL